VLAQEAVFRGYLQTKFSSLMGSWKAVFLQAVLFGLGHIPLRPASLEPQITRVRSTFLGGFLAGAFFRYTRNLTGLVVLQGLAGSAYRGFSPSTVSFMPVP